MIIQFTVPGPPVPQSRPRVFRNGGVKSDSEKVSGYKQAIQLLCPRRKPLFGPVRLRVEAIMPRPKKVPKGKVYHDSRPDLDNIVKAVQDALNGLAFFDDSQIAEIVASKEIAAQCGQERTEITLEELF